MYIVSACLAGINCRYDGKNSGNKFVVELLKQGKAIPVCPEKLGGLPTPRVSCEIVNDDTPNDKRVITKDKEDCTKEFLEGVEKTLLVAKAVEAKKAILKSKNPSCGYGCIYDGTFSGNLIKGNGLTTELLIKDGIEVYTENDLDKIELL